MNTRSFITTGMLVLGASFPFALHVSAVRATARTADATGGVPVTQHGVTAEDSALPEAGPAKNAGGAEESIPRGPERSPGVLALPLPNRAVVLAPWPVESPEGTVLGSVTDGASGLSDQPLNDLERAKLDMARRAIAAAEAAGTRMVLPADMPARTAVSDKELERIKLERLAACAPVPMLTRPGAPATGSSAKNGGRP